MKEIEETASSMSFSSSSRPPPSATTVTSSYVPPSPTESMYDKESLPDNQSDFDRRAPMLPKGEDDNSSLQENDFTPTVDGSEGGGSLYGDAPTSSVLSEIESAIEAPVVRESVQSKLASTAIAEAKSSLSPKKKGKGAGGDKKGGGRVTSPIVRQDEDQPAVAASKSAEKKGKLSAAIEKKSGGRITTPVEEQVKSTANKTVISPPPSPSEESSNFDDLDEDFAAKSETDSVATTGSFAGASVGTEAATNATTPNVDQSGMSIRDRLKLRQQTMKVRTGNTPAQKATPKTSSSDEVMDFDA